MSIEKCADAVFESVRGYLEKRLQELPAPRDGKDGVDGRPGEKGRDGAPGAEGKQGFNGMAGADGRDGVDGTQGEKGMDGAPGRDGVDGKDGPAGPEGPPGKDGEPGRDGVDGAKGLDGAQGLPGSDGVPGKDGTKGIDGEPGRDGRDGPPGRDAAQIDILPAINEERSYARGTFASHKGGLWRAKRATEGMDGWECIVEGVTGLSFTQSPDDPRHFAIDASLSSGKCHSSAFVVPALVYKGVFKDGEQYERGDTTTWGGSSWHCNEATTEKPIEGGKAWTLMTKRGRDGKDGTPGTNGAKGIDGRAGRDLTQMLADGRKF